MEGPSATDDYAALPDVSGRGRRKPLGRVAAGALAIASLGALAVALRGSLQWAGAMPAALRAANVPTAVEYQPLAITPESCTVPAEARAFGLSVVHVLGPNPLDPHRDFNGRVCVPAYEGPDCMNATTWRGTVSLCVDGQLIEGVRMHTRGHVSAMFPKKQFLFKLPRPESLFGMARAKKWVLAMSYVDTSFQRNALAFDIYRQLGGWAPDQRFTSMWWGDVDFGLYYVGEKVMRSGGNRLPIHKTKRRTPPEMGGYIISNDWPEAGTSYLTTATTSTVFNIKYPKRGLTNPQSIHVQNILNEVDRRAADLSDETLAEVLDYESTARYFVLQELAKDTDGYAFSDFWMINGNKLMHAAPWDFDLAFGYECQVLYYTNSFTGREAGWLDSWNVENLRDSMLWIGEDGYGGGSTQRWGINKRQLFLNIWQHRSFRQAFVSAWRSARRAPPLTDVALGAIIDARAAELRQAGEHDLDLWRGSHRQGFFDPCFMEDTRNFTSATAHLREYVLGRARWIDEHVEDLLSLPGRQ